MFYSNWISGKVLIALFLFFLVLHTKSIAASDFDNIRVCIAKTKELSEIILNGTPQNYESKWIGDDIVTWSNTICKVSGQKVKELIVNGKAIIYEKGTGGDSGDIENIRACITKAKNYAGVTLEDIPVEYDSNWISDDVVTWNEAQCSVSSQIVHDLIVKNTIVIYKKYSGIDAYKLNKKISDEFEFSVDVLKNRIEKIPKVKKIRKKISSLEKKKNVVKKDFRKKEESALFDSQRSNLLSLRYDAISEIEDEIEDFENKIKNMLKVKILRKKITLLEERNAITSGMLKQPSPNLKKVSSFVKNSINSILKEKNVNFDYYSTFQLDSGLGDKLIQKEK